MDGDEVVLIYLNDVVSSVATPVRKLVAFERVSLKKEESRTLSFTIENRHLAFLGRDMKPVIEPGQFELVIGDNVLEFEVTGVEDEHMETGMSGDF